LFIGNSYTFFNQFPQMFARLSESGGHKVGVDMAAWGGWTLERHAAGKETLGKIDERQWDYVVLQEQSVIPAMASTRGERMYPAARALNDKIKANGAQTIFFMTWGRRDGLAGEGFEDFAAMQAQLAVGYQTIADELGALVAPVGIAWQNALLRDPELVLWQSDNSHPNRRGSYLAACVFYAVIYQQSPAGLSYRAGLAESEARFLQTIAAETALAGFVP
jgi:hypothetical protein